MASQQKNFYLAVKESFNSRVIPILWSSAKTYYEEYGKNKDEWNWADPWIAFDYDIDQILEICKKNPPNVFGFSVYVWNEQFMDQLAELIKKQFPNCLIVYGGPQINIKYSDDFFKIKHWVDIVCPSDGYGEITIKDLLDNYPNNDFENIPYIYYTNNNKEKLLSSRTIEKKTFNWPKNIYKSQEKYFLPHMHEISYVLVETTRGCPYKCIYCDWGGGTYTKVVSKPLLTIFDELDWIADNKISTVEISNANFGILPVDVDIAQYIVDLKKTKHFPNLAYAENAKNSLDRVSKIKLLWVQAGLLNHYKISIQTLNEEIKDNIERIDPPIEKQVAIVNDLKSKHADLPIKIETIIGLPGDNYKTTLEQYNILFNFGLPMPRSHIWMLLPEAPAYSPLLREKFAIKTVKKNFITHPWNIKPGFPVHPGLNLSTWPHNPNSESVVETYSYSNKEFVDMFLFNSLAQAGDSTGLNTYLVKYIANTHDVVPSDVLDYIFKNFVKKVDKWQNHELKKEFDKVYTTMYNWTVGDGIDNGFDYHEKFPLILPTHMYIPFIILNNLDSFYNELCEHLQSVYQDKRLLDLGRFLSNAILDSSYNPDLGRKFKCEYDWLNYFSTGNLDQGKYTYIVDDQEVYTNGRLQSISWHQSSNLFENLEQFAYKQLGDITISKISKSIRLL